MAEIIRTPQTDEKARMVLAALRMLTGVAGGLPQRALDLRNGSTYSALVAAFLKGWGAERAAQAGR